MRRSGSGPANPLTQLDLSFPICMTQWLSPKVQCGGSECVFLLPWSTRSFILLLLC